MQTDRLSYPGRSAPPGFLILALTLALPPAIARAQEDEPAATIVVEAEPMSEAEERAPTGFVTVIDTSRYEGQFETATSVLAQAVGVQVRRFGGLGAFSTLSIRGSNANQVRFYLDGIPLSTSRRDVVNLANLPLDSLERIEIFRGTVPIGFGGDAVAGVVNLVTRAPTAEPHSELAAYYGSFNTAKAVASHGQSIAGFDVLGTLVYQHGDGDFEFLDDGGTDFDPDDDRRVDRLNNDFDSFEALVKISRRLDEHYEIDLTSDTFVNQQGVPARRGNLSLESSLSELRTLNYLRGKGTALADGRLDATGTIYGVYDDSSFTDIERKLFGIGIAADNATTTVGGNLLASYFAGDFNRVSGFLELEFERFTATDRLPRPTELPAQERLDFNLALQDEIGLFEEIVLIVPTLRYEHIEDNVSGQFSPAGEPIGGREGRGRDLFSPSIGAEVRPWSWISLKGNIGRYQRAPSFSELFGTRGFVRGNPELEPETALNRDVGFVARAPRWRWLDEAGLEYVYYNNDVDDLITLVGTAQSFFSYVNFGSARLRGHELTFHSAWVGHLSLDLNYTNQDATNVTPLSAQFGRQLPLRPENEVYARAELFDDLGKLYFEVSYVDGNFYNTSNFDPVPPRDTYNVGFVVKPQPWLGVGFEVANLTDNEITDVLDFPLPGRSYIGSVTARF